MIRLSITDKDLDEEGIFVEDMTLKGEVVSWRQIQTMQRYFGRNPAADVLLNLMLK